MNQITTKISATQLQKPTKDTAFAHESAKLLVEIIEQNGWSRSFSGSSKHLQYEAWQTAGKFYGYTVKTGESEYVEYGGVKGFTAKAWVIDSKTGIEIGGAEAACLDDEPNWKNKPKFQLKSMAQTRAGSKALRQILGFVVALAGYNPTPAEEMLQVDPTVTVAPRATYKDNPANPMNDGICADCGGKVTIRVRAWSLDKHGRVLCMGCQKKDLGQAVEGDVELISETLSGAS